MHLCHGALRHGGKVREGNPLIDVVVVALQRGEGKVSPLWQQDQPHPSHKPSHGGHMTHLNIPLAGFPCHLPRPRLLMTHAGELFPGGERAGGGGVNANALVTVVAWRHGWRKGGRRAEGMCLKL